MNVYLLPLLILYAAPNEGTDGRYAEAVEVYKCDFEGESDINFDAWPDGWTRLRGQQYPQYLKIAIERNNSHSGQQHLRVSLDGGAAALYSSPIQISPAYSYVLEGYLKTERLKHDVAYFSVTFYDADQQPVETFRSQQHNHLGQWTKVVLGPMIPSSTEVRTATVSMHLEPTAEADLVGAALFDEIWFGRLPRMTLHTNSPHNVYTDPDNIEITCLYSGMLRPNPAMLFELLDLQGNVLLEERMESTGERAIDDHLNEVVFTGKAVWRPEISEYGFYRARVSLYGGSGRLNERTGMMLLRSTSLALIMPHAGVRGGEFGWALPRGDRPLPLPVLTSLLGHAGINWVKFPVWYGDEQKQWADQLAWFAERLSARGIEMVGVLDQPPAEVRSQFGEQDRVPVASVFVEPELWRPVVDPVITRLSLKVRWWQLGGDDDTSFVAYPSLETKIREIKSHFSRFGQHINLGMSWRWLSEPPAAGEQGPPWGFISYTVDPAFTADELKAYLGDKDDAAPRWTVLQPLPRSQYSTDTRAQDLVSRMMAAKIHRADGIFIPEPFNDEHGLMNSDGTPGELLLPWRTTALMISGSDFVGSIIMPSGSHNFIFARDDEAVMVVWADKPCSETIYLGEDVQQVDLWGRTETPDNVQENGIVRQQIQVGTLPTFLTGVNLPIARWRISFKFDKSQLSTVFGREQAATYRFTNHFQQGVGGVAKLHTPSVWQAEPREILFKLAEGEELTENLKVLLRADASSGPQPIRIDFEITADQNYRFSVYRTIQVGLGDVVVELTTHLNEQGQLIVEQQLVNKTDEFVSFNCMLFAPNRRRQRQQVFNLNRGRSTNYFVLPDGEELLGKTLWLRAEEIDGNRILNYQVVAER